MVDRRTGE
jgi:hypothetical protein